MAFDKSKFMMNFKGRPYLTVAGRVVWFRQDHPDWTIETTPLELNHQQQFAIFRCRILDETGRLIATATKKEDVKGFGDYLEKSESGSIGRALGLCGYGTDGDPDFDAGRDGDDAHIVDTPQGQGAQRDYTASRPPNESRPPVNEAPTSNNPACVSCGKPLTKAQQSLSERNFGRALCPQCQTKDAQAGREAVAA